MHGFVQPQIYHLSTAFQARNLDIVTDVIEPMRDFLAVEKVAQRVEVYREGQNDGPEIS